MTKFNIKLYCGCATRSWKDDDNFHKLVRELIQLEHYMYEHPAVIIVEEAKREHVEKT